jgi:hypothetical protein
VVHFCSEIHAAESGSYGDNQTVFVDVVKPEQIMEGVPGDRRDLSRDRGCPRDVPSELSWLSQIGFDGGFVRIGFVEGLNRRCQIGDVFLGAFNF